MYQSGIDRNQSLLFTTLDDYVSSDNPVRTIDLVVDMIISENKHEYDYKGNSSTGRPAYPFDAMMKLFIYCYMNRVKSSRSIATECKRNIELHWLLQGLAPEFRTIAYFREDYQKIISKFNKHFKRKLLDLDLASTTYAIDGSKFKANANKDMISRKATLEKLKTINISMQEYLTSLEHLDKEESPASELSKSEIESKISSLNARLLELQGYLSTMDSLGKNHLSRTDEECNLMKSRDGFIPGYNVQFGVEDKNHFIMGDYVSESSNDIKELAPMIEELRSETGIEEVTTLTDAGYGDIDTIEQLEKDEKINCYSSLPPSQQDDQFQYDKDRDLYICSQGKELKRLDIKKKKKHSTVIRYKSFDCKGCPIREKCTTSKTGREITRFSNAEYREAYRERMSEKASKAKLKRRKAIVEHVFGNIKVSGGKIPILTRGKRKVSTEIKLYVLSYNMKRLLSLLSYRELLEAVSQKIAKSQILPLETQLFLLKLHNFHQKLQILINSLKNQPKKYLLSLK